MKAMKKSDSIHFRFMSSEEVYRVVVTEEELRKLYPEIYESAESPERKTFLAGDKYFNQLAGSE